MKRQAIITVGLQFGDESKGATVDHLCRIRKVDVVVRYSGGCQCAHNVVLPDGRRHTFAQFGAGTLAGVDTYVGPNVVIDPVALENEALHLESLGVKNPRNMIRIHPDCLVATDYHRRFGRAREIARGGSRHGSCGMGVGEARRYWLKYGEDAIRAADLRNPAVLFRKMELLRQRVLSSLSRLAGTAVNPPGDHAEALSSSSRSVSMSMMAAIDQFFSFRERMPDFALAVFEGAQGVLLDEWHGFHPNTTWSNVTPHHALEMAAAVDAEVTLLGVMRAFTTRHGAGPLPTYDPELSRRLADPNNPRNEWQGDLRTGWLDLPLLRYAASVASASVPLSGLAVSWMDHADSAKVAVDYDHSAFIEERPLRPDLGNQSFSGELLSRAKPIYQDVGRSELLKLLSAFAPLAVISDGPTHADRQWDDRIIPGVPR